MKHYNLNLLLAISLLIVSGLACSNTAERGESGSKPAAANKPAKLESYSLKGVKFAWFKVPTGLNGEELIATAQKLHEQEPDTQLILVDDDSQMADYISYAKAISGQGEIDKPMPVEWADKHIIANVQKYMSGKFVLCEGYGSKEIADLK